MGWKGRLSCTPVAGQKNGRALSKPLHYIRIFRQDETFLTLKLSMSSTVTELIGQLGEKTALDTRNCQIILKKRQMKRVLAGGERPIMIQKRILNQAGYEEDRISEVGQEDNSYLWRFSVLAQDNDYHEIIRDISSIRLRKFSHVDLSGQNLITIPATLYSKASEIISLDFSSNLSLDLPKDFIQSCENLRDIKFFNNKAWKLPPNLSRASRLTYLDVSNNRLEQLENAELSRLSSLVSLKLANNRLRSLLPYFGTFKSIRILNVSSNDLNSFPKFICDLESLVHIDISFNGITNLPDEISKLKNSSVLLLPTIV